MNRCQLPPERPVRRRRELVASVAAGALLAICACGWLTPGRWRTEAPIASTLPAGGVPVPTPGPIPTPLPTPILTGVRILDTATTATAETRPVNPALLGEGARMAVGREFDPVYFAFDSSELDAAARRRLSDYAQWLREHANVWVCLAGHCDARGSAEYNYNLGMARSLAVRDFLVDLGVEAHRLYPISFGEDMPAAVGDTEQAYALNRRVELWAFVAPEGAAAPAAIPAVPGGAPAPARSAPASGSAADLRRDGR